MSIEATPGEVWMVDFGLVAKKRPVLVLAVPQPQDARALVIVVPLDISATRTSGGSRYWQATVASQALGSKRSRVCEHRP